MVAGSLPGVAEPDLQARDFTGRLEGHDSIENDRSARTSLCFRPASLVILDRSGRSGSFGAPFPSGEGERPPAGAIELNGPWRQESMKNRRTFLLTLTAGLVAAVVIITPVIAEEIFGFITNVDVEGKKITIVPFKGEGRSRSHDHGQHRDRHSQGSRWTWRSSPRS